MRRLSRTLTLLPMRASLLLALTALILAPSVPAQSLPDWAEPTPYVAPPPAAVTETPSMPSDPAAVPLDGGLGLLALAGAGLAARRLRAGRDEE